VSVVVSVGERVFWKSLGDEGREHGGDRDGGD
jgi:hypothetical protein